MEKTTYTLEVMKDNMKYIEITVTQLKKLCHNFNRLPPKIQKDLETDPLYRVRITENGDVEIGYRTDEWILT